MEWERYIQQEELAHTPPSCVECDLKYSLWSGNLWTWEEYAPHVLELLRLFPEKLTIHTSPRKEVRYGTVTIGFDGDHETATKAEVKGEFHCDWDGVEALSEGWDLGLDEEGMDWLDSMRLDLIPHIHFSFVVPRRPSDTPDEFLQIVLAQIDMKEGDLLSADDEGWDAMCKILEELARQARGE